MMAAFLRGPKIFNPAVSNSSTIPADSGTSGPTIVKSTLSFSQIEPVPGSLFPGLGTSRHPLLQSQHFPERNILRSQAHFPSPFYKWHVPCRLRQQLTPSNFPPPGDLTRYANVLTFRGTVPFYINVLT